MIEQFVIQTGALGILAYVVYDQRKVTNKLIQHNTLALNKVSYFIEYWKKNKRKRKVA
jgi:hypothetical protein